MKLKNIKCVVAATGILTIATIGIIISGNGSDDISEAEMTSQSTEVITEAVKPADSVSTSLSKTGNNAVATGAMTSKIVTSVTTEEQQTTENLIVTTEKSTEHATDSKVKSVNSESSKKSVNSTEGETEKSEVSKPSKNTELVTEKVIEPYTEQKVEKVKSISDLKTSDDDKKAIKAAKKNKSKSEDKKSKKSKPKKSTEVATEESTTEEATTEAKEEQKTACGYVLQYDAAYDVTSGHLTKSNGSIRYNGHRETWYSTNESCGKSTAWHIPGKHVASDGTIRDWEGYICVASSDYGHGTVLLTSVGPAKVYDCGCSHGTVDVYTCW